MIIQSVLVYLALALASVSFAFADASLNNVILGTASISGGLPLSNLTFNAVNTLVQGKTTNSNWGFGSTLTLSTNQLVWPWNTDFTCVGKTVTGYIVTLVSSNLVVGCSDHSDGGGVTFLGHDGNQYSYTFTTTNSFGVASSVYQLNSSVNSQVSPTYLLPVGNYTNILANCEAVWIHKNTARIDTLAIAAAGFPYFNYAPFVASTLDTQFVFGNDAGATSGDSGDPIFLLVNGVNVLLAVTQFGGNPRGDTLSDPVNFSQLSSRTAGLQLVPSSWISDFTPVH